MQVAGHLDFLWASATRPHVLETRLGEIESVNPATCFSRLILSFTPMPPFRQPSMNSGLQEKLDSDSSHEVLFTVPAAVLNLCARTGDGSIASPIAFRLSESTLAWLQSTLKSNPPDSERCERIREE